MKDSFHWTFTKYSTPIESTSQERPTKSIKIQEIRHVIKNYWYHTHKHLLTTLALDKKLSMMNRRIAVFLNL